MIEAWFMVPLWNISQIYVREQVERTPETAIRELEAEPHLSRRMVKMASLGAHVTDADRCVMLFRVHLDEPKGGDLGGKH